MKTPRHGDAGTKDFGLRNLDYQTLENIFLKVCSLLHAYSSLMNSGARF
jgi:hypothetical protein